MELAEFWNHVQIGSIEECWPWLDGQFTRGYGAACITLPGKKLKTYGAHRVVLLIVNGQWPIQGNHRCDNPPCCNPFHLYDGDQSQNMQDRYNRDRVSWQGDNNPSAFLTEAQVQEIRAKYHEMHFRGAQTVLAKEYGVRPSTINRIVHNRRWSGSCPRSAR